MRRSLAEREGEHVRGFRRRGHRHVSRLEGFTDAVLALAVTLLVVSLEVPHTFNDLLASMTAFIAFAFSFSIVAQIWFMHCRFFRRYALEDTVTTTLTLLLLFVILFFTYPLKFLSFVMFGLLRPVNGVEPIAIGQTWQLMTIYGIGYAAVFTIFALMHRHALHVERLELTPLERMETTHQIALSVVQVIVALTSIVSAVVLHLDGIVGIVAGMLYPILIALGIFRVEAVFDPRLDTLRGAQDGQG